jgi:hypothetical protein
MTRLFKTAKGTELPLLNLRGKDYLEVKYRLVWFREEHPEWSIETEFLNITENSAFARALVKDQNGRIIATSHKAESVNNFPDFLEKAETGAIGRALALIGFGTQFCADELDEGERIVDAPAQATGRKKYDTSVPGVRAALSSGQPISEKRPFDLGDFQVGFGRKYLGKRLRDIPQKDIESYIEWLDQKAAEKNSGPDIKVNLLKDAVDRYYHPEKYSAAREESENPAPVAEETANAEAAS